jgi:hypothetical protein
MFRTSCSNLHNHQSALRIAPVLLDEDCPPMTRATVPSTERMAKLATPHSEIQRVASARGQQIATGEVLRCDFSTACILGKERIL